MTFPSLLSFVASDWFSRSIPLERGECIGDRSCEKHKTLLTVTRYIDLVLIIISEFHGMESIQRQTSSFIQCLAIDAPLLSVYVSLCPGNGYVGDFEVCLLEPFHAVGLHVPLAEVRAPALVPGRLVDVEGDLLVLRGHPAEEQGCPEEVDVELERVELVGIDDMGPEIVVLGLAVDGHRVGQHVVDLDLHLLPGLEDVCLSCGCHGGGFPQYQEGRQDQEKGHPLHQTHARFLFLPTPSKDWNLVCWVMLEGILSGLNRNCFGKQINEAQFNIPFWVTCNDLIAYWEFQHK